MRPLPVVEIKDATLILGSPDLSKSQRLVTNPRYVCDQRRPDRCLKRAGAFCPSWTGRGLSIRKLAEEAGVSTETIYSLEHGRREFIWPRTAKKLADALGVDPRDLAH